MASNFNIHHNVNELMKSLEIDDNIDDGITADAFAEHLIKSVEQKSKTHGAVPTFLRKLECQSDADFRNKYDELKVQNVNELDPMVHLLARITDDKPIRFMFQRQHKKSEYEQNKAHNTAKNSPIPIVSQSIPSAVVSGPLKSTINISMDKKCKINSSADVTDADGTDIKIQEKIVSQKKRESSGKRNVKSDSKVLSLDYSPLDWSRGFAIKPMKDLTIQEQQNALIEDLLYVLVGVEGKYMRLQSTKDKPNKFSIIIDKSGDELLHTLATRITALCPHYSHIIHFIDETDNGRVNQALAAAMRDQIKDYFTLIAQLETKYRIGDLTLQKMWYLLQPCFMNLEILKHIASNVLKGNAIGGAVLSILHEKTISLSGNTKGQEFCRKITQKASVPYFETLEKWIYEGLIFDPRNEFFVTDYYGDCDDKTIDLNDDFYWDSRYTTVRVKTPVFFVRYSDTILKTGKYLSIIRGCGRKISPLSVHEPLTYTTEERNYSECTEAAYKFASKELLHLLMNESDLIGRLRSIKHYFLMDQGDFVVQFMDLAGDELEKDIDDISLNRLDSLLELSLRTSMMNSDPYKDNVRIELLPDSLLTQMSKILNIGTDTFNDTVFNDNQSQSLKGYDSLALTFDVSWPLSLILNHKSITCYQMLFRHLFYCKYVERSLENVWKENKIAKGFTLNAVTGYAQAFALRQKMLNFVQNLAYYIMVEVIDVHFVQLIETVNAKVTSVDDMITIHGDYIEKCLRDGMLTASDLLQSVVKLLQLCVSYSEFMKSNHRHATQYELLGSSEPMMKALDCRDDQKETVESVALKLSFQDHVSSMHEQFNVTLHEFLDAIQLQSHENYTMLPVLYRFDFNGYYSHLFESKAKLSN